MSMGERLMVRILAALLRIRGLDAQAIDASEILLTDDRHQNAQPIYEPSQRNAERLLLPLLKEKIIPVVTGYLGATKTGAITTLGRGGSDYSATYLASLIHADDVWIWTDVNGVMSGDPRRLKNAQIIDTISYHAVSEFAYFGAKVLHPRAVEPLIAHKIPLRVCNTFNPDYAGTRISPHDPTKPRLLNAVTAINGLLVFAPTLPPEIATTLQGPSIQTLTEQALQNIVHQDVAPAITVDSHTGRLLCYVIPTTARKTATEESVATITQVLKTAYPTIAWRVEPVSIVAAIGVVDVQQTMQVLNAVRSVKADLLAMGHGSPECALLVVPPDQAMRVLRKLHNMAVTTHQRLGINEAQELCPPVPDTPKRRVNHRQRRSSTPPHRSIPL
jgi:aspartate kinase